MCPHSELKLWRPSTAIAGDLAGAAALEVSWRPTSAVESDGGALKDSADLMYGFPADILICSGCRSLYRATNTIPADIQMQYRKDPYPPHLAGRERITVPGAQRTHPGRFCPLRNVITPDTVQANGWPGRSIVRSADALRE